MLVTGLNTNKEKVTANRDEVYYTKDRSSRARVFFLKGSIRWDRLPETPWKFGWVNTAPQILFQVIVGTQPATNVPTFAEAKNMLRALSPDGKIYDEEGWDGVFENGNVVLY